MFSHHRRQRQKRWTLQNVLSTGRSHTQFSEFKQSILWVMRMCWALQSHDILAAGNWFHNVSLIVFFLSFKSWKRHEVERAGGRKEEERKNERLKGANEISFEKKSQLSLHSTGSERECRANSPRANLFRLCEWKEHANEFTVPLWGNKTLKTKHPTRRNSLEPTNRKCE